jgi:hypothetical protein
MDYTIIIMILVAVALVLIMWYYSSDYYTDGIKVNLSSTEDKLVAGWYNEQKISVEMINDVSNEVLASMILSELYNVDAESDTLVFGTDLATKYHKLTGKRLVTGDTLFNLRDSLALSLDIAIVRNIQVRKALQAEDCDLTQLRAIIHNRLHEQAVPYLKKVLEHRWGKLTELEDNRIINNSGSYVHVRSDTEEILHNVVGHYEAGVVRLNLLCSEREFGLLLKRWRRYTKSLLPQTS